MSDLISDRIANLGICLPEPMPAAGAYVPFLVSGSLVFISGQLPVGEGCLDFRGKVGERFSVEDGQAAARRCALNILAQLSVALNGDLDRVVKCVKLCGFINSTTRFDKHAVVMNGASELMVEVFGDIGRHARSAVGVSSLPLNVAVEVDAIFEIA